MIIRMKSVHLSLFVFLVFSLIGCTASITPATIPSAPSQTQTPAPEDTLMKDDSISADVLSVKVTGEAGKYQFNVEVSSSDTGCDQYADWWEVLSEDRQLLYRRVLLHSHVDEQPFIRSGGPVPIDENTVVLVRAHMNTLGYGGQALKGNVASGFEPVDLEAGFAKEAESQPPLPEVCAF